jgi:hypothetical protein
MDTSKRMSQVHGVDAAERPVLRRKLSHGDGGVVRAAAAGGGGD